MSKSTHGGKRKGAGRKPNPDRLIRIDARLSKSQIEYLKSIDTNVSKAIRTITQRSEMKTVKYLGFVQVYACADGSLEPAQGYSPDNDDVLCNWTENGYIPESDDLPAAFALDSDGSLARLKS